MAEPRPTPFLCPSCSLAQLAHAHGNLACPACGWHAQRQDGVIDLAPDDRRDTQLDVAAYAADLPGEAAYWSMFTSLDAVVRQTLGDGPLAATLELGAGNGAWTWGLARSPRYRNVYATDISPEFLRRIAPVIPEDRTLLLRGPAEAITCAPGSLDLVVGRSFLHHIHDYEALLAALRGRLRPGGAAVFFEPCLQGKLWIAFFMEVLRRLDRPAAPGLLASVLLRLRLRGGAEQRLSARAHSRLHGTMRHILKDFYHSDIDAIRAGIEDKYVFDIDTLLAAGRAAGFAEARMVNQPQDGGLALRRIRGALEGTLGDEKAALRAYQPVFDAFEATFGLNGQTAPIAPMVHFVFRA